MFLKETIIKLIGPPKKEKGVGVGGKNVEGRLSQEMECQWELGGEEGNGMMEIHCRYAYVTIMAPIYE